MMQHSLVPTSAGDDFLTWPSGMHDRFLSPRTRKGLVFSIEPLLFLGNAIGTDQTSNGSRSRAGKDGARFNAPRPWARPKPRDERPQWDHEPHGGGPQTQSSGDLRSSAGREGGADATFSGDHFCYFTEDLGEKSEFTLTIFTFVDVEVWRDRGLS